ncbi:MAG: heme exporter protein CcmB [Armatimonadetes bacterium]|nr:heme exporter protein CcmB [Armatimonadota bacterium]
MSSTPPATTQPPPAKPLPAPPAPSSRMLSGLGEAWAVFRKDLLSELRTRYALNALLVFALTTLLLVAMTVVTQGQGLTRLPGGEVGQTAARATLLAGLLWIILFFSGMSGLARAFVKEEEARTAPALRLAAQPLAVFFGKMLFNVALLVAMALLIVPLFVLFLKPDVKDGALLLAETVLGSASLACVTTILGAIVARAESRASLFAALAFPIVLPVLVIVVNGTAAAFAGGPPSEEARNQLVGLVSYVVMLVTLSAWLFEQVWRD